MNVNALIPVVNTTPSTTQNSTRTPTSPNHVDIALVNAIQVFVYQEPETNSPESAINIANSSAQNSTRAPTQPNHVDIDMQIAEYQVPVRNSADSSSNCPDISGIVTFSMPVVLFFVNLYDL